jgi:hypothetical protein
VLFGGAALLGWGFDIPLAVVEIGDEQDALGPVPLELRAPAAGAAAADSLADEGTSQRTSMQAVPLLLAVQAVGTLLVCVWAAGTAVVLVGLLRGLAALVSLRATLVPIREQMLIDAAAQTFRLYGIRRRVELHHTPLALTPFSLGLVRARIVLPQGLADCLNADQLRYVLLHEAAHIRRRDHWVALLQGGCTAMFWWNPLLHRVHVRLARLREQICDDHVIWAGGDGRGFAETLVRVAEWGADGPEVLCSAALLDDRCGPNGDGPCKELEERILRLVQKKPSRVLCMSRRWRLAVAVGGLLISVALPIAGLRAAAFAEENARATHKFPELTTPGQGVRSPAGSLRSELPAPADKHGLGKEWLMQLPAGFVHEVSVTPLGGDRYRLEPRQLNSSGVYEVRGGRLVIVEPNDRRLLGFAWEIHPDGHLTLVDQPPTEKTGVNYLGAVMVPVGTRLPPLPARKPRMPAAKPPGGFQFTVSLKKEVTCDFTFPWLHFMASSR